MSQYKSKQRVRNAPFRTDVHNPRPRRLKQSAVFNPRGTHRLARTAPETTINMRFKRRRLNCQSPFLNRPHQIYAPTRTIILVTSRNVSWTGLQTESTVNAGENFLFFG